METLLKQAHQLLEDHLWEFRTIQDLEYIAKIIDESAIQVFDKQAGNRVRLLMNSVKAMECKMTREHYLFIMQMANVLIGDDHSFINLTQFGEREFVKYAGFVATFLDGNVIVIHSKTPEVPRWSYITKVNGIAVMDWLQSYIKYASPSTENPEVNLRRASAFLSVYNPFSPVASLSIIKPDAKRQCKVKLEYVSAKKGMFQDKLIPKLSATSLHNLIHKLIYIKLDEKPLYAQMIPDVNMLYFHMHGFPNMDKQLYRVMQNMTYIRDKSIKWVVLDLRNNFGGSLSAMNAAMHFLYGDQFIKSLQKDMAYNFAISNEFMQQYYDQVILPVISDETSSKPVKAYFMKFLANFNKKSNQIYKEPAQSPSGKNFLEVLQKQVAKKVIKNKSEKTVIIITDSHCYSACTWTAHIMRRIPNVVLIGKHISATKSSGNALKFDLPSMMGSVAIPQLFVSLTNTNLQKNLQETQSPDIFLPDSIINSSARLFLFLVQNFARFQDICIQKARLIV